MPSTIQFPEAPMQQSIDLHAALLVKFGSVETSLRLWYGIVDGRA